MPKDFTIGDVIRKARKLSKWNQERLGKEAQKFAIRDGEKPINKSTVSKVETDPYSSEFGTVWRLIAALGLTLSYVEQRVDSPFLSDRLVEAEARRLDREIERRARRKQVR